MGCEYLIVMTSSLSKITMNICLHVLMLKSQNTMQACGYDRYNLYYTYIYFMVPYENVIVYSFIQELHYQKEIKRPSADYFAKKML